MYSDAIEMYKQNNRNINLFSHKKYFTKEEIKSEFQEKSGLLNSIEDGISILDKDLNIISVNYTMKTWYSFKKRIVGGKCYSVYHDRKEPCEVCPVRKIFADGIANRDIVPYYIKKTEAFGWHEVQGLPIMDNNNIFGVVEYVKDITYELNLYFKIAGIEYQLNNIKEQNELLKSYLEQLKSKKGEIEETITSNYKKFVKPLLKQLKESCSARPVDNDLLSFLDAMLENIIVPYIDDSAVTKDFTAREIQIMSLIKGGKTSKEIAQIQCLSTKTVDFHRANIRKKLGLDEKEDLHSFLIRSHMMLE